VNHTQLAVENMRSSEISNQLHSAPCNLLRIPLSLVLRMEHSAENNEPQLQSKQKLLQLCLV
jgi:hypothetical protein